MSEHYTQPHAVVSFDIWSTLLKSNPDYKQARATQIMKSLGNPSTGMEDLEFLEHVDAAIDTLSDSNGLQYGFAERIGIVATHAGVTAPSEHDVQAMKQDQLELVRVYPPKLIEPGLKDILTPLLPHKKLAVVSNTGFIDGSIMRGALDRLGVLDCFTYQVFSNEVGYSKPSPQIFDALLQQAGVSAPQVIHIGDNKAADYDGPRAFGMDAVHLTGGMTLPQAITYVR